jgi:uncharacterized protein (DUF2141 family)
MKILLFFTLSLVLLAGCQNQPAFTDTGEPGQIKAVVFYDDNGNGSMDNGETGAQIELNISQEISCPPSRLDNAATLSTNLNGVAIFMDLNPGKYCVAPLGNYVMTTKMTQEVYVSSEEISTVMFGISK